ncbi:MAG: hypothetical protein K2O95_01075 [Clostridia bacterium]|nr:hypothetical protein [Clostridia bacterium]MDE7078692.1 hypothetical protein [Clostridia bacterium]
MKKNNFRPSSNNLNNNIFNKNTDFNAFGNMPIDDNASQQGSLEEELNKYSHMSEERLMQEMFTLVDNGRKNGTLDNEKLEAFFNSASCMLNNEQITKLRYLVDMAKNS